MSQLEEGGTEWERKKSITVLDIGDTKMGKIEFLTMTSSH